MTPAPYWGTTNPRHQHTFSHPSYCPPLV